MQSVGILTILFDLCIPLNDFVQNEINTYVLAIESWQLSEI